MYWSGFRWKWCQLRHLSCATWMIHSADMIENRRWLVSLFKRELELRQSWVDITGQTTRPCFANEWKWSNRNRTSEVLEQKYSKLTLTSDHRRHLYYKHFEHSITLHYSQNRLCDKEKQAIKRRTTWANTKLLWRHIVLLVLPSFHVQ